MNCFTIIAPNNKFEIASIISLMFVLVRRGIYVYEDVGDDEHFEGNRLWVDAGDAVGIET